MPVDGGAVLGKLVAHLRLVKHDTDWTVHRRAYRIDHTTDSQIVVPDDNDDGQAEQQAA